MKPMSTRCAAVVKPPTALAIAAILAAGSQPAVAQVQRITWSVQSEATATDNGNGAPKGEEKADLLMWVRPRVAFHREGAGLRLNGYGEAALVASARDTRDNRILPGAHLDARSTIVERMLYAEALVDVRQVEENPFATRAEGTSTLNTRTASNYRFSPVFDYEPTPRIGVLMRYDVARTRYAGSEQGDVDTDRGLARFTLKPQPIGLGLEWTSERTDYAGQDANDLRTDRLSAVVSLAIAGEWVLGVSAGSERVRDELRSDRDTIYGVRAYWVPSPRTAVAALADRRFFGTGWNISAQHRNPYTSIVLKLVREPSGAMSGLSGSGLASFLDAILTTRQPDPLQRQEAVGALLASRGLQTRIQGPTGITADYAQLLTGGELTWAFLGIRNTVTVSLYIQELEQLLRDDGTAIGVAPATADTRQKGISFGFNRRLTPNLTFDSTIRWSQIEGLALRAGEQTREGSVSASIVRQLSPRTNATFGARVRRVSSDAFAVDTYDETAVFVGLGHQF